MFKFLFAFFLLSSPAAFAQDAPEEAPTTEAAAPADAEPSEEGSAESAEGSKDAEGSGGAVPVEEAAEASVETVSAFADAVQSKNWALALGLLLSLLVAFANKLGLKDKVGGKAVPWVTAGVGVAGAVGAALVAGISPFEAVSQGLIAGVAAIGGWEMLLKHLMVPKSDASE